MTFRNPVEPRIQWHEGMLLSPQHLQSNANRQDQLVALQSLLTAPFGWGIRNLRIDTGLLPAGLFRVLQLEAILPDGTLVQFDSTDPLHGTLELDLAPFAAALSDASLNIYLVLPQNRRMNDGTAASRFRSVSMPPVDDEVSQALPVDIPRLLPNLSLMAGDVPPALFTRMLLANVHKDNELIKLAPVLPPLLEMPKDSALWEQLSSFAGQLRAKAAFLAKQTSTPSSKLDDRVGFLEHRERLHCLIVALPQLEAVLQTPALHPYGLYLALCGLLGPLSLLRPGSLPMIPPPYDHGSPVATLEALLEALQDSLLEVNQNYREYKFEFRYGAFEIVLKPEWIDKELILGLRGQPERDLVAWMSGAIVGSQSAYTSLRERRVLGATRKHIESAESLGVRASSGYTLFSIQTQAELTLPDEPLVVSNSAESASAQRPQELVLFVRG